MTAYNKHYHAIVVGVGNVGTRVAAKCAALGMRVVLNDPPLARQTRDPRASA